MKKEELEKEILKSFSKKPTTNALTTEKGYFTEKEAEEMTSGTLDLVWEMAKTKPTATIGEIRDEFVKRIIEKYKEDNK